MTFYLFENLFVLPTKMLFNVVQVHEKGFRSNSSYSNYNHGVQCLNLSVCYHNHFTTEAKNIFKKVLLSILYNKKCLRLLHFTVCLLVS